VKSDGRGGNGVHASVSLVSSRGAAQIWPAAGGRKLIPGTDEVGYATDLDSINVAQGDVIRFEVYSDGDNSHDAVSWTPSVGYVDFAR